MACTEQPVWVKERQVLLDQCGPFYGKVACLADEGKVVNVVSLDFIKAFDTIYHSVLLEKLPAHCLDRYSLSGKKLAGWLGPESGDKGS